MSDLKVDVSQLRRHSIVMRDVANLLSSNHEALGTIYQNLHSTKGGSYAIIALCLKATISDLEELKSATGSMGDVLDDCADQYGSIVS